MRIFFAGGGTGGHLYPGLAIARALVARDPAITPFFVGARRGIERDVLPTSGFAHVLLELHPMYRSAPWKNLHTLTGAVGAWRTLSRLAQEQRPVAVVGTGGYAAAAALAWGRAQGLPLVLHECDSHPGKVTRLFAPRARLISLGFPEAEAQLAPGAQTGVAAFGNPITPPPDPRPDATTTRAQWGFPDDAFVVLVVGGSQGARAINEAVADWCQRGLPEGVCLIWSTGRAQADAYTHLASPTIRVVPFLSPITDAYAAANLAVTRAGAMTLAELCAWGIPSILVPLPTAAQDHQAHNARTLAAAGAAVHLPQTELDADAIDATVRELRARRDVRSAMTAAASARGRPTAAARIAEAITTLVLGQPETR